MRFDNVRSPPMPPNMVGYYYDAVKKIKIRLKTRCYAIPEFRLVVDHTIEDTPVCDVASGVVEAMISLLTVHAAANVVELF